MGSVPLKELWPIKQNLNKAKKIGAISEKSPITAMHVGYKEGNNDELVYLNEEKITVGFPWRHISLTNDMEVGWFRLEADSHSDKIKKGFDLVVAGHPYSNCWFDYAGFKPGSHKGHEDRYDPKYDKEITNSNIIDKINTLTYDFWCKDSGLTAGVLTPSRSNKLEEPPIRNFTDSQLMVFGVCENFELYRRMLAEKHFKELTDKSFMLKSGVKPSAVINHARGYYINLAISQALAGPHEKSEDWIDRPVIKKAEQILREHIERLSKWDWDKSIKSTLFDETLFGQHPGSSNKNTLEILSELSEDRIAPFLRNMLERVQQKLRKTKTQEGQWDCAEILIRLVPLFGEPLINEVLDVSVSIDDNSIRNEVLKAFGPLLLSDKMIQEAFRRRNIN